jgi:hypothetical protein
MTAPDLADRSTGYLESRLATHLERISAFAKTRRCTLTDALAGNCKLGAKLEARRLDALAILCELLRRTQAAGAQATERGDVDLVHTCAVPSVGPCITANCLRFGAPYLIAHDKAANQDWYRRGSLVFYCDEHAQVAMDYGDIIPAGSA